MKDNNNHSEQRRDFLKKAGLLLGAGITVTSLSSLIVSCESDIIVPSYTGPVTVNLSSYSQLATVGGTVKVDSFIDGTKNPASFILRRVADKEYVALEAQCSHIQGEFNLPSPTSSNQNLVCQYHAAEFSTAYNTDLTKEGLLAADPNGIKPRKLIAYQVDTSKLVSGIIIVTKT